MTPIIVEPTSPSVDAEELTLDGLALHSSPFRILADGFEHKPSKKLLEWVRNADSDGAKLLRPPKHETAEIQLRLRLDQQASMDAALGYIGQVVDKLQEAERQAASGGRGLELVWSPAGSTFTGTFYVLAGEVDVPKDFAYLHREPVFTITLTCDAFIYSPEVTTSTTTSSLPLITMTVADVPGDVPAEARFTITDNAGQSRDYVAIGLENLHYSAANALLLDSDDLVLSGYAGAYAGITGAYDPGAPGSDVIRATLTTTAITVCSTAPLGHVGTYRAMARLYASATDVSVRLVWRVGRGQWTAMPWQRAPFAAAFWEVDLGEVKIRSARLGGQSWEARFEGKSTTPGDTLAIDFFSLIPSGEGYGKARRTVVYETPSVFADRDEFRQSAGALAGKTSAGGQTWAGAGDADDFQVDATDRVARRTAVSDANLNTGRYAVSGVAASAAQAAQVDVNAFPYESVNAAVGVLARYVDTSNWLMATYGGSSTARIAIRKRVAGTVTTIGTYGTGGEAGPWATLRLAVDAGGRWFLWAFVTGYPPSLVAADTDTDLATGGALASGKPGFYDAWTVSASPTRDYANFATFTPSPDAAIFAGQSCEFRSHGDNPCEREDSSGVYWGGPSETRGGRLWLPPAGDEDRTTRIAVLARRNDIETLPSANIADSTSLAVSYRSRWLNFPRAA